MKTAATFHLLDGTLGWRTAASQGASAGADGIRLAALPGGPLALDYPDGSLGGLVLPRGMALSEDGTLYLLSRRAPWQIKRFDPQAGAFQPLVGLGGEGAGLADDARHFLQPLNIAIAGRNLYVADAGNRRVQVFLLEGLALRHVWRLRGWRPVDVATRGDWAYILDRRNRRIYRHQAEAGGLRLLAESPWTDRDYRRMAVDSDGRVYLLDVSKPGAPSLDVYDPGLGAWQAEPVLDAGAVRAYFPPPAVRLYFDRIAGSPSAASGALRGGIFCLPESLARACDRAEAGAGAPVETPLALCPTPPLEQAPTSTPPVRDCPPQPSLNELFRSAAQRPRLFTRDGEPVTLLSDEMREPHIYGPAGYWASLALDSRIYRCQWHRVELELDLPPGASLEIRSRSGREDAAPGQPPPQNDPLWQICYRESGPMQVGAVRKQVDFLVQSRPGQFLWLDIALQGDGFGSPVVHSLRVHYPRQSYLEYLPGIFSDDSTRWFLERFLSIFQTEWDGLETRVDRSYRLFDPATVEATGGFIEYLARCLALPLEGEWDAEQKRRLLLAVKDYYPRRGTQVGLQAFLRVYLENMNRLPPAGEAGEAAAFPLLVEGFRERPRRVLEGEPGLAEDTPLPLWGPAAVGRLQVGVFSRPGEVRLVSTGDPQRDLFYEHANRFRVFVPAAWVRTAAQEAMLRRAVEAEKPAHAAYSLHLVEARLRVGVQSTVGLDTIVGGIPQARLACPDLLAEAPPSQAPRRRLGYDLVLSGGDRGAPALPAAALKLP